MYRTGCASRVHAGRGVESTAEFARPGGFSLTTEALRAFSRTALRFPRTRSRSRRRATRTRYMRLIDQRVKQVVVCNPQKTRAIAEAKVKTDKVDAGVLCRCWRRTICRRCGSPIRRPRRCSPAGRTPGAHRPAAHEAKESGAVDFPASQPDPALPGGGPLADQGSRVAGTPAVAGR